MKPARKSVFAVLCLMCQMPGQPVWSFDLTTMQGPIYLCQFGDTAQAYAFTRQPDGRWEGMGELQGWDVTIQDEGLVARNADDVLILGDGSASLLQGGRLVQGACVDPSTELAQLFETEEFPQEGRADLEQEADNRLPALPAPRPRDAVQAPDQRDPWMAGVLSILDLGDWDAEQVAQIIDALNMDNPAKLSLKAELKAAAKDPARIRALARQIRAAFGVEIAATAELRSELRETRRELATVTQAYEEQSRTANDTMAQLAAAQANGRAAERANAQALTQIATLKATLNTAITSEDEIRSRLAAAIAELSATREKLAVANKRIAKLGGVPIRP